MLDIRNLDFSFGTHQVLQQIYLHIAPQTLTALLGPNGSGKSTLLRCLLGFYATPPGCIFIQGKDLTSFSSTERSRQIAYIPQDHRISCRLSVFDIVLLGRKAFFHGNPQNSDYVFAEQALQQLGLSSLALRPLNTLSGGQRQLVWIAKALCQQSPVILLDEPTSNLDIKHTLQTADLLQQLQNLGKTILMVSHDILLCQHICSHFALLKNGQLSFYGKNTDISNHQLAQLFDVQSTQFFSPSHEKSTLYSC